MNADEIVVYWIPGCGNCVRIKGYLTDREIPFTAVNVQNDLDAVEEMRAAGIIGLPVVRKGDRFVPGADLQKVNELLEIDPDPSSRTFSVGELAERASAFLDAAGRYAEQLPLDSYATAVPGMEHVESAFLIDSDGEPYVPHRTYRALVSHIIGHGVKVLYFARWNGDQDQVAFALNGAEFSGFGEPPDTDPMERAVTQLRDLAEETRKLAEGANGDYDRLIRLFYGTQTIQQVVQTMTVSLGQHTRQLMEILGIVGVTPNGPLRPEETAGLTLPVGVFR